MRDAATRLTAGAAEVDQQGRLDAFRSFQLFNFFSSGVFAAELFFIIFFLPDVQSTDSPYVAISYHLFIYFCAAAGSLAPSGVRLHD